MPFPESKVVKLLKGLRQLPRGVKVAAVVGGTLRARRARLDGWKRARNEKKKKAFSERVRQVQVRPAPSRVLSSLRKQERAGADKLPKAGSLRELRRGGATPRRAAARESILTPYCRRVLSAPPQAMTWSSMAWTVFSWCAAGLKTLKFSKSVKSESPTCARTSATCSSPITRRRLSTARAPSELP